MFNFNSRKFIASFIALAVFILLPVSIASAFVPTVQVGVVQGLVSDPSSNPLDNADVSVTCNSNVRTTITDASGFYFVQFPNGICTDGMTASVSATKGGLTGSAAGVLTDQGTIGFLNLDVAVVHVMAVPEFGLFSGVVAAAGSTLLFLRRRLA